MTWGLKLSIPPTQPWQKIRNQINEFITNTRGTYTLLCTSSVYQHATYPLIENLFFLLGLIKQTSNCVFGLLRYYLAIQWLISIADKKHIQVQLSCPYLGLKSSLLNLAWAHLCFTVSIQGRLIDHFSRYIHQTQSKGNIYTLPCSLSIRRYVVTTDLQATERQWVESPTSLYQILRRVDSMHNYPSPWLVQRLEVDIHQVVNYSLHNNDLGISKLAILSWHLCHSRLCIYIIFPFHLHQPSKESEINHDLQLLKGITTIPDTVPPKAGSAASTLGAVHEAAIISTVIQDTKQALLVIGQINGLCLTKARGWAFSNLLKLDFRTQNLGWKMLRMVHRLQLDALLSALQPDETLSEIRRRFSSRGHSRLWAIFIIVFKDRWENILLARGAGELGLQPYNQVFS
ncbi:hypothetical protein VP01_1473g1 [Puccinia sorghi]|uniref:Uncharacterized protein n=1 Tax=Puccinia sorghi TaxID=27349 RepID=A0A0L6VJT5_9BASI|nr:hypothetical protein VP01_1473g1 [Puccinia sorghi]